MKQGGDFKDLKCFVKGDRTSHLGGGAQLRKAPNHPPTHPTYTPPTLLQQAHRGYLRDALLDTNRIIFITLDFCMENQEKILYLAVLLLDNRGVT